MKNALPIILLAAGSSRRWGTDNKLSASVRGVAMVRRVAEACRDGGAGRFFLVVSPGASSAEVSGALAGLDARTVENPDADRGIGTSVRAGFRALLEDDAGAGGFLVIPGDLPWLRPQSVAAVLDAFHMGQGRSVIVPVFGDQPGHPVAFPGKWRLRADEIPDVRGARVLIQRARQQVRQIALEDPGIVRDCDRPGDLA